MRRLALAVLLLAAIARGQDSPLVKAAKSSGGPKKKTTKKVITNRDVKKSGGKLTQLPASNKPAATAAVAEPAKGSLAKQDEQRRANEAAARRVAGSEAKVKSLEAELDRIEQTYYEAMDPNYRDTTIKQRFDQTKRQLDDARKELADARDAQKKLSPKS